MTHEPYRAEEPPPGAHREPAQPDPPPEPEQPMIPGLEHIEERGSDGPPDREAPEASER